MPFGLVVEDIRRGVSRLRNRVIGRLFKELRLIEQWGSGVGRMIESCQEHGLPAPAFEEVGTHFRVTFRLEPGTGVLMEDASRRMLMAIEEKGQLSTRAVAAAVDFSTRAARTRLKVLVDRGLIVEAGSGPTDPRRVYVPIR